MTATLYRIEHVSVTSQRDVLIYTFTLTGEQLLHLGFVERFGQEANGVNRKLDEAHALEIADAMLDEHTLWLDSIVGGLSDGWTYDADTHEFHVSANATLSIDDGQHRWHALSLLNETERRRLAFTCVATIGLDYERRLKVFRMQNCRKPIDRRLDLAQRHRIGEWDNDVHREAYELILKLNSAADSPLKGLILLTEEVKRPHEGRHRPYGVNANGLHRTLRTVLGKKSPLGALAADSRARFVFNLLRAAADQWKKEWRSEDHSLTTARGVNALLLLVVKSPNFRGALKDEFTPEGIRRALSRAKNFKWAKSGFKNLSEDTIVERLDRSMIERASSRVSRLDDVVVNGADTAESVNG